MENFEKIFCIEFNFAIYQKLRGQKITKLYFSSKSAQNSDCENCVGKKRIKISFFESVFDTEKYGHKIFPKFELFGFFRN